MFDASTIFRDVASFVCGCKRACLRLNLGRQNNSTQCSCIFINTIPIDIVSKLSAGCPAPDQVMLDSRLSAGPPYNMQIWSPRGKSHNRLLRSAFGMSKLGLRSIESMHIATLHAGIGIECDIYESWSACVEGTLAGRCQGRCAVHCVGVSTERLHQQIIPVWSHDQALFIIDTSLRRSVLCRRKALALQRSITNS